MLIKTVEQGNPFQKENPGRIRRIAYGVFVWMPLEIFSKTMLKGRAIRFSTLDSICKALDCQPGDILSYRKKQE